VQRSCLAILPNEIKKGETRSEQIMRSKERKENQQTN